MQKKWTTDQMPSQAGRIAVVTGANSGLGLETSVALAAAGAKVIMACRNPERASAALAEVKRRAPQADASMMTLDLSSLASVRDFATQFNERHPRLDLLINNAGILGVPFGKTVDGFETQMATNHLGHFALTGRLIDKLMATPGARVVTVGSLGHWQARNLNPDDLNYDHTPYSEFGAYANSKLANLLFVAELARRLVAKGAPVISVGAHPGGAATNIKKFDPAAVSTRIMEALKPMIIRYLINSAEMGALPSLYAATAPDVVANDYFGPDGFKEFRGHPTKARRSDVAMDLATAKRLWEVSAALTGVSYLA